MDILKAGRATRMANPDWFTGTVWQDPIVETAPPARVRAVSVTFAPGARTNWHTHPLGQTLHITQGTGRVCTWGGTVQEVRAGDTVWIPPGEKHWHGAGPTTAMTHIAIHEHDGASHVDWLEPVTEAQFAG